MWAVEVNGMRFPLAELDSQLWLWLGSSQAWVWVVFVLTTPQNWKLGSVLRSILLFKEVTKISKEKGDYHQHIVWVLVCFLKANPQCRHAYGVFYLLWISGQRWWSKFSFIRWNISTTTRWTGTKLGISSSCTMRFTFVVLNKNASTASLLNGLPQHLAHTFMSSRTSG